MTMPTQKGTFVMSLDFELYWGVRDARSLESYRGNLLAVRRVVPALLNLFQDYDAHATWATVGFLFFETQDKLIAGLPSKRPDYTDARLSPYPHIEDIGHDEKEDPFHYAPSLIQLIASSPHQEVGSHTFSHYYCLEKGQDEASFRADLEAAVRIARQYNLNLESLVFPRNQFNERYLSICSEVGIKAYRGNESSWMYRAKNTESESLFRRGMRLLDAYLNLSGHNCYSEDSIGRKRPVNVPSSRFLRPFSPRLRVLEPLRMRRILSDLTYAARHGLIYHLWWHPHNFGDHTEENLLCLRRILDCFADLKATYGMESLNMGELTQRLHRTVDNVLEPDHASAATLSTTSSALRARQAT